MTNRQNVPTASSPLPTQQVPNVATNMTSGNSVQEWFPRLLMVTNLLLLLLVGMQLFHRPHYEYQTVAPSDYEFEEVMNKLGANGWKAESCRRATSGSDYSSTASYECIMSRPKLGW